MDVLKKLQNIDLTNSTPNAIRSLLKDLTILCVPFFLRKNVYILRGRRGSGYTKRSEMTYCPPEKCTSMQRATLAGQTMFYGVISDDQSHQENARAIVTSECSKLCHEGITSFGRETITVAHWEVIKPLHVVSLINDETFADIQNNALLNQLREAFIQFHGEHKSTNAEKEISRFICSEFSKVVKDEKNYLISATVATDIIKDMRFDGIVFPSVQLGGQAGLNIALTPKTVNHKLKFLRTFEQTIYKNGDSSFVRIEKVNGKKIRSSALLPDNVIEEQIKIKKLSDLPIIC